MIKRIFLVDFLLLIIFTIIFFTCFGSFLVTSTKTVQTVTLSSEGPANQIWPDSMGEYQLAEEVIHRPSGVLRWYRHVGRDDRFIMYNNFGNIFLSKISLLWYILDHRWYISHTDSDTDDVKGDIRSFLSGPVIEQGLEWEYRGNCITVR